MKVVMLGADRSVKGGVSAMVNNLYEAGISQKVNLVYIGTMVDGSSIGKLFKAAEALLKFLTVLPGADIVHLNMAADASCFRKLIFLNIASAFGKKIVVHHHGGDFKGFYEERCSAKMREKVRRSLNKADLFLVLSENWKLFFENIVSPDKIFVLENCVPIPEKAKQDYSGHQAVFLGRLCKEKGIGELLESAKRVRKAVPDFELVLGGFWEKGMKSWKQRPGSCRILSAVRAGCRQRSGKGCLPKVAFSCCRPGLKDSRSRFWRRWQRGCVPFHPQWGEFRRFLEKLKTKRSRADLMGAA